MHVCNPNRPVILKLVMLRLEVAERMKIQTPEQKYYFVTFILFSSELSPKIIYDYQINVILTPLTWV